MKIGIVGFQATGKSSLFQWLSGVPADPSLAHATQLAAAEVPDQRLLRLAEIYQPKKVTAAAIQLVDTPGLSRDSDGNAARLAHLRETHCLVIVVGAYLGVDPSRELRAFEDELLFADYGIVSNRVDKLQESVKKPKPNREQEQEELEALRPVVAHLESGRPIHSMALNERQRRSIRSFQLLTEKPRRAIVNLPDDQSPRRMDVGHSVEAFGFPINLQLELEQLVPEERRAFCDEMAIEPVDRGELLRELMRAAGHMLFFTAGDKEVRSWLIPQGATAEMAADSIHSDLARGFVRAERMTCEDLFQLGSEREIKAQQRMSKEHKDYVVQDGDILHILAAT